MKREFSIILFQSPSFVDLGVTGWALAWLSADIEIVDKTLAKEQQGIRCACKRPPAASHITRAGNFTAWKQHCITLRNRAGELCRARGELWLMETQTLCRNGLVVATRHIRKV